MTHLVGTPISIKRRSFVTSTENRKTMKTDKSKILELKKVLIADMSGITPIKNSPRTRKPGHVRPIDRRPGAGGRPSAVPTAAEQQLRRKVQELETHLKRKETEISTQRSRINILQNNQREKENYIRDLELKLPRVLSDISRGMGGKEKGKCKEMRETMRRNHDLGLKVKDMEMKLKDKDRIIEKLENTARNQSALLLRRESEIRSNRTRVQRISQIESKLEDSLQENQKLSCRLAAVQAALTDKTATVDELRCENSYLYGELNTQYSEMIKTEKELAGLAETVATLQRRVDEEASARKEASVSAESAAEEPVPLSPWKVANEDSLLFNITYPFSKKDILGNNCCECEDDHDDDDEDFERDFTQYSPVFGNGEDVFGFDMSAPVEISFDTPQLEEEDDELDPFEDSLDRTNFLSRMEELDLKMRIMLNKLPKPEIPDDNSCAEVNSIIF